MLEDEDVACPHPWWTAATIIKGYSTTGEADGLYEKIKQACHAISTSLFYGNFTAGSALMSKCTKGFFATSSSTDAPCGSLRPLRKLLTTGFQTPLASFAKRQLRHKVLTKTCTVPLFDVTNADASLKVDALAFLGTNASTWTFGQRKEGLEATQAVQTMGGDGHKGIVVSKIPWTRKTTPSSKRTVPHSFTEGKMMHSAIFCPRAIALEWWRVQHKPDNDWRGMITEDEIHRLREMYSDVVLSPSMTGSYGLHMDEEGILRVPGSSLGFQAARRILAGWQQKMEQAKWS